MEVDKKILNIHLTRKLAKQFLKNVVHVQSQFAKKNLNINHSKKQYFLTKR